MLWMRATRLLIFLLGTVVVGLAILFGAVALGASPDVVALVFVLMVVAGGAFAGAFGDRILGPLSRSQSS
jgi:hypothetical protein